MAGKSYIKIGSTNWDRIKKMYVKTGGQTWTAIRKAYVKTVNGWEKVFDTASNRPFIRNNDIPKIRLNTFRTDSSYNPTGTIDDPVNPVVEAPPVQQMGPTWTSPTLGWPYESLGRHLWGYDGDWVSGNGSAMTFVYTWLYNLSGNRNDNTEELGVTSTTGRTDMLTNLSSHLGQSDGDYFDRNFLTFRVTATNSAGSASFESAQVYIVRERPTGSITMADSGNASAGTSMSATFTYSNNWYNKTDTANSYVEWFAVDNLTDTLTTSNRVQVEYLNTFVTTGTTTKTATTFHVPTITNKYYFVRTTLNNSNTLPAKYAGSVISIVGFTPNSAFTATANKSVKTVGTNGAFNLTNATKAARYYDAGSSTWRRYVSVDIGQSTDADRYEVQIEGQYSGTSGTYSFASASWVVVQSFFQSPYVLESSRTGGVLNHTATVLNYLNYRVTARSLNGTSTNGAAYSNGGTSSSFQYVVVPTTDPSAPSISNIQTATDATGSYITFSNYQASNGSNEISYYTYSTDNGSSFQQISSNGFITSSSGKIYLTAGSSVNLRIRATNLDGATSSSSNLLSITVASQPGAATSVVVKSFTSLEGTIFFTSGSNTGSVRGYLEYDSFSTFDSLSSAVNVSSNTAAKIQLTGANSSTRTYTSYLTPFSGSSETGNQGALTSYSTKVLNGFDSMTISLGTASRPSDRTISVSWTVAAGAPTHYVCRLYNYTSGSLISTKTIAAPTTTVSFNSSDGVVYSTLYYIAVQPQYQYTSSVTYENFIYTSNNVNSGANVTAATSTSIVSMSRLNDTTVRAYIGSSGASGPYYQLFWTSQNTAPSTGSYDAASTTSTVMEDFGFSAGTIYFYVRSSSENLGNTTVVGSGTVGTYSDYGPATGAASYTFTLPTGGTASVTGSSSVGSTLTLSLGAPSASPSADGITIVWRVNDGGTGGNSYTNGSILQNGGTTFVIPQYLYGSVSSVGYLIRAEVTWNNGVGSQSANSTSTAVTAAGVAPSGGAVTLTPSGTQMAGTTISANVTAMSGTATITYATTIRKKTGSPPTSKTDGTEVSSGTGTGNGVATHVITDSEASGTPDQFRAFTTGTNSFGNSVVSSNTVVSTPFVPTQYTISWSGNGGTVSPTSQLVNSGTTVSAPTPTRSGYTFLYWRDSPSAFSYAYQINPGGSWTVTSNIQFYAYWQAAAVAVPGQPTSPGLTGSGVVSWGAPTSGGPVDSYEIQFYTASNSSGSNAAGPYTVTGIGNSPHQLTSPYGGTNANYARVQVRARNSSGAGLYGAWVPSSTTYT